MSKIYERRWELGFALPELIFASLEGGRQESSLRFAVEMEALVYTRGFKYQQRC